MAKILSDSEECLASICVSPINKKSYNFILTKSGGHIELLHGAHAESEFLSFAKSYAPHECSYEEFVNKVSHSKEFLSAYRNQFYQCEVQLPDYVKNLVSICCGLDFSTPQTTRWGQDGFSLSCWMPNLKNEFLTWCCHCDEYYAPVVELANALLDIAGADPKCRFGLCLR